MIYVGLVLMVSVLGIIEEFDFTQIISAWEALHVGIKDNKVTPYV
jgi:hypothetical protein